MKEGGREGRDREGGKEEGGKGRKQCHFSRK